VFSCHFAGFPVGLSIATWSGAWLFCRCGSPPGCSVLSLPGSLTQPALSRFPLSYHLVLFHVSCPSSVCPYRVSPFWTFCVLLGHLIKKQPDVAGMMLKFHSSSINAILPSFQVQGCVPEARKRVDIYFYSVADLKWVTHHP
jgi:hypothetical protein